MSLLEGMEEIKREEGPDENDDEGNEKCSGDDRRRTPSSHKLLRNRRAVFPTMLLRLFARKLVDRIQQVSSS